VCHCLRNLLALAACLGLAAVSRAQEAAPADEPPPADETVSRPKGTPDEPAAPISPSQQLLRDLGMDLDLLADLEDGKELSFSERRCFFEMLIAASRAKPGQLARQAEQLLRQNVPENEPLDGKGTPVAPLLNEPEAHRGRLVIVSGEAHRLTKVAVYDKDVRERLGRDYYFNVFLTTDDSQGKPLVFCVCELPEIIPKLPSPQAPQRVRIAGFFMKTWAYPAQVPEEAAESPGESVPRRRVAPLLFARELEWLPDESPPPEPNVVETPVEPDGPDGRQRAKGLTARQWLNTLEIEGIEYLTDGQPIRDEQAMFDETETLLAVLYHVNRRPLMRIDQWAGDELDRDAIEGDPAANRGEFFSLSGRLTRIEVRRPVDVMASRLELEQYYRCTIMLDDGRPVVVFAWTVPKAWQAGGEFDERVGAKGLFLKLGVPEEETGRVVPIFVASRIAWYPHTLLGDLGMDVGLLDEALDRKDLLEKDRECFYQLLWAAGRTQPGQLLREAKQRLREAPENLKRPDGRGFSVVPLFNEAAGQRGRLVVLTGMARSVVKIRVDDEDIRARFGIDHYYNVFFTNDESNGNPLVFCLRELPEGMPPISDPGSAERVQVAGFFMKTWAYPVQVPDEKTGELKHQNQLAPLLIGRDMVWLQDTSSRSNVVAGAIAGGLFVLALLGVWIALWQYGRGDKAFRERTIAKHLSTDAGISLGDVDLKGDGTPDFSRLEAADREKDE